MTDFCIGVRRQNLETREARRALKEAGITRLSLDEDILMNPSVTREDVADLRARLDEDGLHADTCHPPFGSFNEPFSTLRQSRQGLAKELDWMREFLLRCGILGMHAIPLHTGGAMLPHARKWETESARAYVEALMPAAEKAGVIIAVENTNHATPVGFYPGIETQVPLNKNIWEFDDTGRILDFVHSIRSPFVRICYDTGHSHLLGKMMPDLDAFFDDIALFHIHDNDGAGNDAHIQPGYGNAPWRAFFDRIQGMDVPLYVEAGPRHGDLSLMMRELNAIREGRVVVKPGGFLDKDEDRGTLILLPKEGAAC